MDDKEANDIAAALAPTQRPMSRRLAGLATIAMSAGERLRVGAVTLAGAYVGWRLVAHFPDFSIPPAAGAAIVGLLAAAAIPVARPNNSINRTPLRGAGYLKR